MGQAEAAVKSAQAQMADMTRKQEGGERELQIVKESNEVRNDTLVLFTCEVALLQVIDLPICRKHIQTHAHTHTQACSHRHMHA